MAILAVVVLGVAGEWDRLVGATWLGMDTATAFYPWYSFLGEQLRAGHIPAWNPHEFSGSPFAADPESGWMYLPAMLAFSLLPIEAAIRAHLLFHVLLAGLSAYGLARALGANALGGLLAATIYAHSGFFEGHNVCCYAYTDVAAWLPMLLLGAELALRASSWRSRALFWGVAGLALSQILAAWIGQGAYYALLVLGSFVAYRCLVSTPGAFGRRLARMALHGAGVLVFGFGLGAAGVLPRIAYDIESNLPGGYPSADVSLMATSWSDWGLIDGLDRLLLSPGFEYIGWLSLLLALLAPLVARRLACVAYFGGLAVAVLILARAEPTPLHAALALLPGFERVHARSPERILIVFYLAPAFLAAATLTWLTQRQRLRIFAQVAGIILVAAVAWDLHLAWEAQAALALAGGGDYEFRRVDLASYFAPTPAARFLLSNSDGQPFRYFGYAGHVFGGPMPYTLRWADRSITALEVNNRGLMTGLDDVQGYNPVHLARYDWLMSSLNGHDQNYHHADIFDSGFDSPLLDLLNVRYVLMPATLASDEVAPHYQRPWRGVYSDETVRVLENPSVLPRAWIVHSATRARSDQAARALLDPDFDPRRTAVLEAPPPILVAAPDGLPDRAEVVGEQTDRVRLRARTGSPGLLVLSEVYDPAWHAYVDGQAAPIYVADVALRAVAVPPGDHTVEMVYESPALVAGLVVSAAAATLLAGLAILQSVARSRDESGEVRCKTGAVPQL